MERCCSLSTKLADQASSPKRSTARSAHAQTLQCAGRVSTSAAKEQAKSRCGSVALATTGSRHLSRCTRAFGTPVATICCTHLPLRGRGGEASTPPPTSGARATMGDMRGGWRTPRRAPPSSVGRARLPELRLRHAASAKEDSKYRACSSNADERSLPPNSSADTLCAASLNKFTSGLSGLTCNPISLSNRPLRTT